MVNKAADARVRNFMVLSVVSAVVAAVHRASAQPDRVFFGRLVFLVRAPATAVGAIV